MNSSEAVHVKAGETDSTAVAPYERGLPASDVLKGSLTRFLPGSIVGMTGLLAVVGWPVNLVGLIPEYAALLGALTLGFGAGLEAMRRWLYPDAKLSGSRSFIAGLVAPSVWFIWGGLGLGVSEVVAWSMFPLLGLILAFTIFFAWLTPTPEEKREGFMEQLEAPGPDR